MTFLVKNIHIVVFVTYLWALLYMLLLLSSNLMCPHPSLSLSPPAPRRRRWPKAFRAPPPPGLTAAAVAQGGPGAPPSKPCAAATSAGHTGAPTMDDPPRHPRQPLTTTATRHRPPGPTLCHGCAVSSVPPFGGPWLCNTARGVALATTTVWPDAPQ